MSKKGIASAKKKFAAKNKNDVDVMIKVKDEEGKIIEFENEELAAAAAAPKKKKKTAKTVRAGNESATAATATSTTIEAEDTLAMIKNALKSGTGKMAEEFADVFAWLTTIANIHDVDLEAAIREKYIQDGGPEGTK